MAYGIKFEVWGDYALFTRPELHVERMSYDVITPSAARGILEAIYWHPGLRWSIDRIHVCNEIAFTNIRRNEVDAKLLPREALSFMNGTGKAVYLATKQHIQQRASTVLRNVHYVIEAHFEMTDKAGPNDSEAKYKEITLRRLQKGQCFHMPYLGTREFPANVQLFTGEEVPSFYRGQTRDLGLMLYDLDYHDPQNITPMFFRAVMQDGTIHVADQEVLR